MPKAKDLKAKQREELFSALQARFEKNMNRHKGLEWAKVSRRAREANPENCGRSMKWKEPAASRMSLVLIKRRANSFFMIVLWKAPMAAEVFVTTVKRWSHEKNINQKTAQ